VPKIDWLGDDYSRYEPRLRAARPRRAWLARRERDLRPDSYSLSLTTDFFPPLPAPAVQRRPLHLIWGEPQRDTP
jgi:hypothetical protein